MQCILGTSNPATMAFRALSLGLLFAFVTVIFGLPTSLPEPVAKTHEEHTLSTELLPPPVDEKEHHATIYVINLYAVKNGSSNASEEMFQNEVIETIPDILEPLVSVLLVLEDDENEEMENHPLVDLDEFAEGLESQGFKVDKIDLNSKAKVLKMKLEKEKAESVIDSALKGDTKKFRQKRTICFKCGGGGWGGGGWGGYPSGGQSSGGGHQGWTYPTENPNKDVILVVVSPCGQGGCSNGNGNGKGHHHHHHGHHGYPHGGGGCGYGCGGRGGYGGGYGGGSYAHASASAGSWGRK